MFHRNHLVARLLNLREDLSTVNPHIPTLTDDRKSRRRDTEGFAFPASSPYEDRKLRGDAEPIIDVESIPAGRGQWLRDKRPATPPSSPAPSTESSATDSLGPPTVLELQLAPTEMPIDIQSTGTIVQSDLDASLIALEALQSLDS